MSEEAREFTGLSATEAAINACEEFGVNRSGIEYEVISETGEGFDKQVVIKAKLKEGVEAGSANSSSGDDEPSRDRDRGGRDRGGHHFAGYQEYLQKCLHIDSHHLHQFHNVQEMDQFCLTKRRYRLLGT